MRTADSEQLLASVRDSLTKDMAKLTNLSWDTIMDQVSLGPIWLPGFGFTYCSVLVLEFSGSHYCDRGVQCSITWDNIPNTNAHDV